jgi:hypothetical protein
LGDRRRASEGRTFAITGAQPLPLFLSQPPFGSGAAACPRVSERDLPLSVERRFSLIEPRLGKAQCVGPGILRRRIVSGRTPQLHSIGLCRCRQQKKGRQGDHQSFIATIAHIRDGPFLGRASRAIALRGATEEGGR